MKTKEEASMRGHISFLIVTAMGSLHLAAVTGAGVQLLAQQSQAQPLTNDDVIKLTVAGLGPGVIVAKIRSQATAFDVSTDALVKLKAAGVSDTVLQAMAEAGSQVRDVAAASAQRPRATTDPEATPVAASRDRTWEAVMAYTTENSHYFLGIETVDRESGLLISRPTYFPMGAKRSWADCGKTLVLPNFPDKVIWNIVVTGNDSSSTVRVNGRWFHNEGEPCKASKGVLEREMMDWIRAYAERSR